MASKLDKLVVKVLGAKYGRIENRTREEKKGQISFLCMERGREKQRFNC